MKNDLYQALSPVARARWDYREGDGCQDSNPYDKETQRKEFDDYAWEMHKIWNEEFKAEQHLARSVEMEKSTSG